MEAVEVREALKTAIMLGEVSHSNHIVDINGIGEVQIARGNAAFKSETGEWLAITRENIELRLRELMAEPTQGRVRRRIESLVFW